MSRCRRRRQFHETMTGAFVLFWWHLGRMCVLAIAAIVMLFVRLVAAVPTIWRELFVPGTPARRPGEPRPPQARWSDRR